MCASKRDCFYNLRLRKAHPLGHVSRKWVQFTHDSVCTRHVLPTQLVCKKFRAHKFCHWYIALRWVSELKSSIIWDTGRSVCWKSTAFQRKMPPRPWRWRRHFSPKRRTTFIALCDVISMKTELFTMSSTKTSDSTQQRNWEAWIVSLRHSFIDGSSVANCLNTIIRICDYKYFTNNINLSKFPYQNCGLWGCDTVYLRRFTYILEDRLNRSSEIFLSEYTKPYGVTSRKNVFLIFPQT